MNKREFLESLEQALTGEVDTNTVVQNVKYYDSYISGEAPKSEEEIIDILGDPRLIAKTIIEAERVAKDKEKTHYTNNEGNYRTNNDYQNGQQQAGQSGRKTNRNPIFITGLSWYHKLMVLGALIVIFMGIIFLFRILAALFLPIMIILIILALFRKR